jgi:hypothetical protein
MCLKMSPQFPVLVWMTLSSFFLLSLPSVPVSFNGMQQGSVGSHGVSPKRTIAATPPASQQNDRQEHDQALSNAICG